MLALLGAAIAIPLGWLTVMAVRFGEVRVPADQGNPILDRLALPGWPVVPILVAPAVFVALAWWLGPTVRARLHRRPIDALAPRW